MKHEVSESHPTHCFTHGTVFSPHGFTTGASVSRNCLIHVFILIIKAVDILDAHLPPGHSVNHQVSGNTEVKIVSVVPHFELATVSNYQRLGVVPAKSPGENRKLAFLSGQQRLESSASKTLLLVIHHRAQVCVDPNILTIRLRRKGHSEDNSSYTRSS